MHLILLLLFIAQMHTYINAFVFSAGDSKMHILQLFICTHFIYRCWCNMATKMYLIASNESIILHVWMHLIFCWCQQNA